MTKYMHDQVQVYIRFLKYYLELLAPERFKASLMPPCADAWTALRLCLREVCEHACSMLQFHVEIRTNRSLIHGAAGVDTHRQWVGRNTAPRNRTYLVRNFFWL